MLLSGKNAKMSQTLQVTASAPSLTMLLRSIAEVVQFFFFLHFSDNQLCQSCERLAHAKPPPPQHINNVRTTQFLTGSPNRTLRLRATGQVPFVSHPWQEGALCILALTQQKTGPAASPRQKKALPSSNNYLPQSATISPLVALLPVSSPSSADCGLPLAGRSLPQLIELLPKYQNIVPMSCM